MSMPLAKLDLLFGYGLAFAFVAAVQASVTAAVAFGLLGVRPPAPSGRSSRWRSANAVLGMALGLFLSAFATSEFQAVQFMPAFILPQLLLAGLFVPRDQMPALLERSPTSCPSPTPTTRWRRSLPTTSTPASGSTSLSSPAQSSLALALGALTLRRRTP